MKKISFIIENNRAEITMDDGKANAMDFDYFEEMNSVLDEVEAAGAKAVIIKGRQGFFSGGLNVKLLATLDPHDVDRLAETFARTMARVFVYPIPTIAVCTGHAIAGGAMLAFACDRRYVVNGDYRIQMNEHAIGIPLPTWMFLIGNTAVPVAVQTEALLHAKAYTPKEAYDKGIFHGLLDSTADIGAFLKDELSALMSLHLNSYTIAKCRLREKAIKEVLVILQDELPSKARPDSLV